MTTCTAGTVRRGAIVAAVLLAATIGGFRVVDRITAQATNPIPAENALAGNPKSEWDVNGSGDSTIQGFATDTSVNKGGTISFKVTTTAATFTMNIYRLGYYQGNGARRVATISGIAGRSQPACVTDTPTGLYDCGNWSVSTSWTVPATAVSGIYIARIARSDTGGASHIPFIVRDDAAVADIVLQATDTTWQAYNQYGGHSTYLGSPNRGYKVSFNRPYATRGQSTGYGPSNYLFYAEYPTIRWLESNGYNVKYQSGVDTDRFGTSLTGAAKPKVLLTVGHDEYWSAGMRNAVEAARNAGVHLAMLTGNEVFWKTRWEASIDGNATPYRTLVVYKETHENKVFDPADPPTWTGTWRDPRFSPPADGGRPENALTGQLFTVNRGTAAITVPGTYAPLRFWRNTGVAALAANQTVTLAQSTLGYEWDEDLDNATRPPGAIQLSSTVVNVPERVQDFGSTYSTGTATHHLTMYRHPSGAIVFGAGTVQWVWGLDTNHDFDADIPSSTPDPNIRQATLNLLADMGVQPATIQTPLIPATASTDHTPPVSAVTSPIPGTSIPAGTIVTVTGTATDSGGGVVAGVEISTDGGVTWRRATGTSNWRYTWVPGTLGTTTLISRATDDSGNIEQPSTLVAVSIAQANCPCSIWTPSLTTPWMIDSMDGNPVEVGLRFSSDVGGVVSGIRFYKASTNTGTHVGHLWTNTGTLLSTVTFSGESASGWQQANFPSPATIQANTTYVISYFAPNGHYSDDQYALGKAGVDQWPLHALKSTPSQPNGIFFYGASGFPNQTWFSDSYSVDLVFTPDVVPPTVSLTAPADGSNISGNAVTVSATASDNIGIAGVQFKIDGANLGAEDTTSPYAITWNSNLNSNATHTLTAVARDLAGNLTTSAPVNVSVFNADTVPPTGAITFPANSATVHGTLTVIATASDNQGVAGLQFIVDGTLVGSELTAPPYSMTWDTTTLPNNSTHTLAARVRDTSNNIGTSPTVTVTVSNPIAGAPVIDAVVSTDQPNSQTTVTSPAFSTASGGELLLAFVATDYLSGANTTVTGVTGGGLTWALVGRTNAQAGSAEVWRAFAASKLTNATVVATMSQAVDSMLTVVSFSNVDATGTNGSGAVGATASASAASGAPSATLTTTRANSWVFGVGNDYDNATARTVPATQTLVHQYFPPVGDTYWVQRILNPVAASGTAVTLNDTAPTGDRYNWFIVEIKANLVDSTPPTVSMTAPADGATVSGKTVAVSANASDNNGVANVQFRLDGANLGAADTTSPYAITWDTTTVANGPHVLSAIATDIANNATSSASITVTVNNDTTAPTVAITSPGAGSTVASTIGVTADAADDVAVAGVQFKIDGVNLGAEVTVSPYAVVWNTGSTPNGTHTLTAVARDAAGNTTASTPVVVTVNNIDATAPTVSMTAPANGATVLGTVTVSASASDNVGVVGVQFTLDGVALGAEDLVSPYSLSWNTNGLANGLHTLSAVARDGAGNTGTAAAISVNVNNDLTPPTVAITAPADGATVSSSISLTAAASDNVGVVGVQFLVDGTAVGAEVTTAPYSLTWSSSSVANGSHTISARARDAAGNQATSAGVGVTVSNVAATPPVIDTTVSVNRSTNATTLVSGSFTTHSANELLLAFIATDYRTGANTTVSGITGGGLTWVLVQRTNVQQGTSEIWRAFAPTTLSAVTITATLSQSTAGSMTVVSFSNVDTTGTNGSGAIGATASANSVSGPPTATLVTTRNNSLVFAVGNDFDNATARTVGPNQTMVNQYLATIGDTYWMQRTTAAVPVAGTSVTMNDTAPTGDRYNFTICEIRPPQ